MDAEGRPVVLEGKRKSFLRSPGQVLGPMPGIKELNVAGWSWLASLLVINYLVPLWARFKSGAGMINIYPSDFIYFYGIGHIAKDYPLIRFYDYSLQLKVFNDIYPLPQQAGAYGPSPYPPYVGLFFSLFARMPILTAFFVWVFVSLGLYVSGIAAAAKGLFPGERLKISFVFSLALAFCPFLHNTLANGQIATLAVFSVGVAIWQERSSRPLMSGLSLSILTYKPTLLLLVVPMLLLTRRFRTFCGFLCGSAALALTATAFAGGQIWIAYAHFLNFFARFVGVGGQSILFLRQYVDLRSFIRAASGGSSRGATVVLMAMTIAAAAGLSVLVWRSAKGGHAEQLLCWAATLTWTLLLNVYVPVYDAILAVIAVLLTLGALRELGWQALLRWTSMLAVLAGAGSWWLDNITRNGGIQFLVPWLVALGAGQLYFLHRAQRQRSAQRESEPPSAEAALN